MAKITPAKLLHTVRNLDHNPPVQVDETVAAQARLALTRMLAACR
jgi:quinolinate synthase